MPRHDRAYGVWFTKRAKGGSKRRGSIRLFKSSKTTTSRYATKRDGRGNAS